MKFPWKGYNLTTALKRLNLPNFLYVAADLMYIIKFDDLHFDPMLGAILN